MEPVNSTAARAGWASAMPIARPAARTADLRIFNLLLRVTRPIRTAGFGERRYGNGRCNVREFP
jgi:hypothetical protein